MWILVTSINGKVVGIDAKKDLQKEIIVDRVILYPYTDGVSIRENQDVLTGIIKLKRELLGSIS